MAKVNIILSEEDLQLICEMVVNANSYPTGTRLNILEALRVGEK